MKNSLQKLKDLFRYEETLGRALILTAPVLGLGLYLFEKLGKSTAKSFDIEWGFWWVLATLLLGIAGLVINANSLRQKISKHLPTTASLGALAFILIFLSAFNQTQIERQHRVLSDENSWESMALSMKYHQQGGVCNQGYFEEDKLVCTDMVNNFKGKATSIFYWVMFQFMEPNRDSALHLNFVLYFFSLIFFFYGFYRIFDDEWLALAISAFLGSMPIFMLQSMSASTEVLYVFLLSVVLLFTQVFKPEEVQWKHFLLLLPVMGLLAQTRQETVFSFLPIFFYYHKFFRRNPWNMALFTAATIAVCWPILNTIIAYRGYDFQGGEHDAHSLANLLHNISRNVVIMLNLEDGFREGLLKYPFYTSSTVLLLAGTLWLTIQTAVSRKYVFGAFLVLFFHLQSLVILVNVSGSFDIDINQRYVLIALPSFALIIGLFLREALQFSLFGRSKNEGLSEGSEEKFQEDFEQAPEESSQPKVPFTAAQITAAIAVLYTVGMSLWHKESFNENILYRNNNLIKEEKFLNTYLNENFPANSVFIYSRPWQMLCQQFSAFNESKLLNWRSADFAKWNEYSNGNVYLVRGQDGYGTVNRKSRVVGFKTTDKIKKIYDKFDTTRVFKDARKFGYPLTIDKLTGFRHVSPYLGKITVDLNKQILSPKDTLRVRIGKLFNDTITVTLETSWKHSQLDTLTGNRKEIALLPPAEVKGLAELKLSFTLPDDSLWVYTKDVFVKTEDVALVDQLPFSKVHQAWGNPGRNKSVENNPIRINQREYSFGIGAHANSTMEVKLDKKFTLFQADIGIDDESACGDGAQWIVKGDGKELARSKTLFSGEKGQISANVQGVNSLLLITEEGENNHCDHTDWGNAWLK